MRGCLQRGGGGMTHRSELEGPISRSEGPSIFPLRRIVFSPRIGQKKWYPLPRHMLPIPFFESTLVMLCGGKSWSFRLLISEKKKIPYRWNTMRVSV
ncbi:hypothetical protein CDAR_314771 [Caerostris darwini]|uniref:Uncharacterized protein n=1 Tax=Caerostris darwini TaxID=1538125 RepID=A0AAV4TUY3_9ARAC|nr:hypothetical protein CDAR_314771 [Caerostris darwini]